MEKNRVYKAVILILALIVLGESAWIISERNRTAAVQEEIWDFDDDAEILEGFDQALTEGRIEAWFQPLIDPETEAVAGAEALSRWKTDDGFLSPSVFVSALENTGRIQDLDLNCFRKACEFQKERMENGAELFPVSVNLSAITLMQEGITSELEEIYRSFGLPEGSVNIEMTESLEMDPQLLNDAAEGFHRAGFLLELDDFGAGYASYSELARIPYDVLKLDKSLTDTIGSEKGNRVIGDLIRMAEEFGMKTVAEGVETKEQADWLRSIGCDALQGYYYAKPMPADEFRAYLGS